MHTSRDMQKISASRLLSKPTHVDIGLVARAD